MKGIEAMTYLGAFIANNNNIKFIEGLEDLTQLNTLSFFFFSFSFFLFLSLFLLFHYFHFCFLFYE